MTKNPYTLVTKGSTKVERHKPPVLGMTGKRFAFISIFLCLMPYSFLWKNLI